MPRWLILTCAVVVSLTTAASLYSPGHATDQEPVDGFIELTVVGSRAGSAVSGAMTLTFEQPMSASALEESLGPLLGDVEVKADGDHAVVVTAVAPLQQSRERRSRRAGGFAPVSSATGGYADIFCNQSHSFYDGYANQFSVQRQCGVQSAPWGWTLSPAYRPTCVSGTLSERGLRWSVVGDGSRPMMAAHPNRICSYVFHGTFNGVSAGTKVDWNDVYTWRHTIGSGGWAEIVAGGKLHFRSDR